MNASARSEVLRETDPVKEHRGDPSVETVLQGLCSPEQTPPRNPAGPDVPYKGAFEPLVDRAGI